MSEIIRIENKEAQEYFDVSYLNVKSGLYETRTWGLKEESNEGVLNGLIRLTVGKNGVYKASDFNAYGIAEIIVKNDGSAPAAVFIQGSRYDSSIVSIKVGGNQKHFGNVNKIETRTIDDDKNATFRLERLSTIDIYKPGIYRARDDGYIAYTEAMITFVSMYPKNYNGVSYGQYDKSQPFAGSYIKAKGYLYANIQAFFPRTFSYGSYYTSEQEEFIASFNIKVSYAFTNRGRLLAPITVLGENSMKLSRQYKEEASDETGKYPMLYSPQSSSFSIIPLSGPIGDEARRLERKTIELSTYDEALTRVAELIIKIDASPLNIRPRHVLNNRLFLGYTDTSVINPAFDIANKFNGRIYKIEYDKENKWYIDDESGDRMTWWFADGTHDYSEDEVFDGIGSFALGISFSIKDGPNVLIKRYDRPISLTDSSDAQLIEVTTEKIRGAAGTIYVPITEIEYLGDYDKAPESAKTLTEDDLL